MVIGAAVSVKYRPSVNVNSKAERQGAEILLSLIGNTVLKRLLCPRTVALVGGQACAEVIRQSRRIGFEGELWPVHPRLDELEGLPVYRSVDALPAVPDAAFVAVNRETTIGVVAALAARRAGGAVCYASGFAEAGSAGAELQSRLAAAAGTMPFFGPNCHGFINYLDGVALWPEQQGGSRKARGVGIVTQSGNIALNLTMQMRGLPIAYVLTLGNQAGVELADAIEALAADDRVTAIGLHIEGISDADAFMTAAAAAKVRGVPIIAIKTGRSKLAADLAVSHTASLGGADAVARAFLRRAGVACVESIPVLLETLKLLHVHGALGGREIASMSSSGGEAGLAADAAEGHRLCFTPFGKADAERVAAALPPLAAVSNPLDYHNFNWGDEAALTAIYAAVMQARPHLTLLVLDFPRRDRCSESSFEPTVNALIAAARRTGAKTAVVSTLPETLPEHRARQLMEAGIVPLLGLEEAMAAIAAAADIGDFLRGASVPAPWVAQAPGTERLLPEWEAKRRLAAGGLPVPANQLANGAEAAVEAAIRIGFPVVLKSAAAALAHKTEAGAVKLRLGDAAAVRAAAAQLAHLGDELLIEKMIMDPVAELIVGFNQDPIFGWYLALGSGGTLVNLLEDTCILAAPASRAEIMTTIRALKVGRVLAGYRGQQAGDIDAAAEAVLTIQDFVGKERYRLLEIEVNPLIVRPAGCGVAAVDALMRIGEAANG
jgi:acetate---CoA ligase (ADP-forming)